MSKNRPSEQTINDIITEVTRARKKFPDNRYLLSALMEEVGELAKEYLEKGSNENIYIEAMQIACVAIRIMEEGDSIFSDYPVPVPSVID